MPRIKIIKLPVDVRPYVLSNDPAGWFASFANAAEAAEWARRVLGADASE